MSFWTFENVRRALAADWIAPPRDGASPPFGASIDTRPLRPGQIFFALRGERTDGLRFLRDAAERGAAMAVVARDAAIPADAPPSLPIAGVDDPAAALAELARAYRASPAFRPRVVAITGSNGKTTTTRLACAVLSRTLRGTQSPKSYNNHLGLPLTLLNAREDDGFVVCEAGTSGPGEIAFLGGIARPDVAVITSVGRAHVERLGSLAGVAREKASLLRILAPGGAAVVPDAPAELDAPVREAAPPRTVRFGESEGADLRVTGIEESPRGLGFRLAGVGEVCLPMLGRHNACNAAAAAAVGLQLGVPPAEIVAALASAGGAEMRLDRREVPLGDGTLLVLNDAYNANPESTLAGLRTLLAHPRPEGGRRVAVLADMLEMGDAGPELHREVGERLLELGAQEALGLAVLVGPLMMFCADRLARALPPERVLAVPDLDAGRDAEIAALLRPNDVVLLKGSRGMRLERVLEALERPCVGVP